MRRAQIFIVSSRRRGRRRWENMRRALSPAKHKKVYQYRPWEVIVRKDEKGVNPFSVVVQYGRMSSPYWVTLPETSTYHEPPGKVSDICPYCNAAPDWVMVHLGEWCHHFWSLAVRFFDKRCSINRQSDGITSLVQNTPPTGCRLTLSFPSRVRHGTGMTISYSLMLRKV